MKVLAMMAIFGMGTSTVADAVAQTRSIRNAATAYGARLDARGRPANINPNRINNRIDSRIENRLALRIERYRVDSTDNPTALFSTKQDDKSRSVPVITPPPQAGDPE